VSGGSGKAHGAYAEYVVALMAACTEGKTKKEINNIIKNFEKNLKNIGGSSSRATFSIGNDGFFGGKSNVEEIMSGRK
jgi:hypothetical protein